MRLPCLSQRDTIPLWKTAWMYVIDHSFYDFPYTSENWFHHPLLFLNSSGGGYCDDLSSVLAKIWQNLGYSSRIIKIEGHVVPEFRDKNGWHMLDPSLGVYYVKKDNVLPVSYLENNSNLIITPESIRTYGSPYLNERNPLTEKFKYFYETKNNNIDVTSWHLDYDSIVPQFILPSKSILEVSKINEFYFLKIKLTKKSKGYLQLPFIPQQIRGNLTLICEDTLKIKNNYNFKKDKYIPNLDIVKVENEAEIYYKINQKNNFLKKENILNLVTSDSLVLNTSYDKIKLEKFNPEFIPLIANKNSRIYENFIPYLKDYEPEKTTFEKYVETTLVEFLKINDTLNERQKIQMRNDLFNLFKQYDISHYYELLNSYDFAVPYVTYLLIVYLATTSSE